MNIKNIVIGLVVAIALILSVLAYNRSPQVVVQKTDGTVVGSLTGPEVNSYLSVHGPFQQGGEVLATSTSGTADVLLATQMQRYSVFEYLANTGNTTLTLPATSTLTNIITSPGESRTWWIHNSTSTGAITLTITAGTGIDLIAYTTADDVIDGTEYAELTCWRQADSDLTCLTTEILHAD